MMKAKGCLTYADDRFAANLQQQEAARWTEYLSRRTRESLTAWRDVRKQIRQARRQAA